jgi:hypothetical protein
VTTHPRMQCHPAAGTSLGAVFIGAVPALSQALCTPYAMRVQCFLPDHRGGNAVSAHAPPLREGTHYPLGNDFIERGKAKHGYTKTRPGGTGR